MPATQTDYWNMSDDALAKAYRDLTANFVDDAEGENAETLTFIEDAILQRIGAPDDADPSTEPQWQAEIRAFARPTGDIVTQWDHP